MASNGGYELHKQLLAEDGIRQLAREEEVRVDCVAAERESVNPRGTGRKASAASPCSKPTVGTLSRRPCCSTSLYASQVNGSRSTVVIRSPYSPFSLCDSFLDVRIGTFCTARRRVLRHSRRGKVDTGTRLRCISPFSRSAAPSKLSPTRLGLSGVPKRERRGSATSNGPACLR